MSGQAPDLKKNNADAAFAVPPPVRDEFDRVYRATTYQADWPEATGHGVTVIALRVDAVCPVLDCWLDTVGVRCWAYLTAANPRSVRLSDADNAVRTAALRDRLQPLGPALLTGRSLADDGRWPAEASFLVGGLDREAAIQLAEAFGQNACLTGCRGEPVGLCWTSLAAESG